MLIFFRGPKGFELNGVETDGSGSDTSGRLTAPMNQNKGMLHRCKYLHNFFIIKVNYKMFVRAKHKLSKLFREARVLMGLRFLCYNILPFSKTTTLFIEDK